MSSNRIVILGGPGAPNAVVFNHLAPRFEIARVVLERRLSRFAVLARRRKRLGLAAAIGQAAFRLAIAPMLELSSRERRLQIMTDHGLNAATIPAEKVTSVDSVNSPECIGLLSDLRPAVVIVNGTRILSSQVLQCTPARFINLHAGMTPRYRGVHGAYWALVENRRDLCGVTVHALDEGIDTGPILAQSKIEPTLKDNFATYPVLQAAAYLPLLDSILPALLERARVAPLSSTEISKLWTHPTAAEYARNRLLRGVK